MKKYQHPKVGLVTLRKNSRAKRVILKVKVKEGIVITLPTRASYQIGLDLLNQNIAWVLQQKKRIEANKISLKLQSTFQIRDKELMIIGTSKEKAFVEAINPQEIHLGVPITWNIEEEEVQQIITELLIHTLRVEGKQYLPVRTHTLAQQKGIDINKVTIKKVRTRWGSCSSKKNINLSLYLMLLSDELIDYVICHELAHIQHQNHSPAFWSHLEKLLPGAKQLDKQLNKYQLPF